MGDKCASKSLCTDIIFILLNELHLHNNLSEYNIGDREFKRSKVEIFNFLSREIDGFDGAFLSLCKDNGIEVSKKQYYGNQIRRIIKNSISFSVKEKLAKRAFVRYTYAKVLGLFGISMAKSSSEQQDDLNYDNHPALVYFDFDTAKLKQMAEMLANQNSKVLEQAIETVELLEEKHKKLCVFVSHCTPSA